MADAANLPFWRNCLKEMRKFLIDEKGYKTENVFSQLPEFTALKKHPIIAFNYLSSTGGKLPFDTLYNTTEKSFVVEVWQEVSNPKTNKADMYDLIEAGAVEYNKILNAISEYTNIGGSLGYTYPCQIYKIEHSDDARTATINKGTNVLYFFIHKLTIYQSAIGA